MIRWEGRSLAGFDLETTSADPQTARIVTASVVGFDGQGATVTSWLANPGVPIPAEASAIHGVTDEMAVAKGESPRVVVDAVQIILASHAKLMPVVIFNAAYDLTVLDREARRNNLTPLDLSGVLIVDPHVLDKATDRYRKGKRTLTACCAHYGVDLDGAHQSEADALAAMRVAWVIRSRHPHLGTLPGPRLMEYQATCRAGQSKSLAAYFARTGKPEQVDGSWPVIPWTGDSS
jgi:DNA polymerase-3 subunit epsilon